MTRAIDPVALFHAFAAELAAGEPAVWRQLLDQHVAASDGYCRCCRRDRWPVSLRTVAELARLVADCDGGAEAPP